MGDCYMSPQLELGNSCDETDSDTEGLTLSSFQHLLVHLI